MIPAIIILSILLASVLFLYLRTFVTRVEESIMHIPPQFIDVVGSKPMIIDIDGKYKLTARHLGSVETQSYMMRMTSIFMNLKALKKESGLGAERQMQIAYVTLARLLYLMTRKEYPWYRRGAYKAAVLHKCLEDVQWMSGVCEQIKDFWGLVKKKEEVQATGSTLRQMYGEQYTWGLWQKASRYAR
jgi:hypothetical protein